MEVGKANGVNHILLLYRHQADRLLPIHPETFTSTATITFPQSSGISGAVHQPVVVASGASATHGGGHGAHGGGTHGGGGGRSSSKPIFLLSRYCFLLLRIMLRLLVLIMCRNCVRLIHDFSFFNVIFVGAMYVWINKL